MATVRAAIFDVLCTRLEAIPGVAVVNEAGEADRTTQREGDQVAIDVLMGADEPVGEPGQNQSNIQEFVVPVSVVITLPAKLPTGFTRWEALAEDWCRKVYAVHSADDEAETFGGKAIAVNLEMMSSGVIRSSAVEREVVHQFSIHYRFTRGNPEQER